MDSLISPLFPPAELTAFANRILEDLPVNEHLGETLMPASFTANDNWTTGLQSNRDFTEEAEYRAWNTESTIGSRPGMFRITGNLVPVSRKLPLQEDYVRMLRGARERGVPDEVRTEIFNDVERLVRMLRNRVERARWEVLDLATFTIGNPGGVTYPAVENGLQMQVDYMRAGANRYSVGTFWDAVSPTILDDILSLVETASDAGVDIAGGAMVVSRSTMTTLLKDSGLRDLYDSVRPPGRLTATQLNSIFSDFGLPRIVGYDAKVKRRLANNTDSVVPIADPTRAYFVPSNNVGYTLYGPSAYSGEPEAQGAGQGGGPVVFVMKTLDPLTYWTVIDAPVIPVLFQPNDTYSVKVLT